MFSLNVSTRPGWRTFTLFENEVRPGRMFGPADEQACYQESLVIFPTKAAKTEASLTMRGQMSEPDASC